MRYSLITKDTTLHRAAGAEYEKDKLKILVDDSVTDMQKRINPECQEERQGFTRLLTTYHMTLALVGNVVKNKGKPVGAIGQGVIRWIKDEECDECICEVYRLQAKQGGDYTLVARFTRRSVSLRTTQVSSRRRLTLMYFEPGEERSRHPRFWTNLSVERHHQKKWTFSSFNNLKPNEAHQRIHSILIWTK